MRSTFLAAISLSALCVAACGGGEGTPNSPDGNLSVAYSYPAIDTNRFKAVSVTPVIALLGSNTPHFSLGATLPAGLRFDTATGSVSGVPTDASVNTTITVTLTVDGFSGSLSTPLYVTVHDIGFQYLGPSKQLQFELPVTAGSILPSRQALAPGTSITYAEDASVPLPAGLLVDPGTGEVSGTPQAIASTANFPIDVTASYAGVTGTYIAELGLSVTGPGASLTYLGNTAGSGNTFQFWGPVNQPVSGGTPQWVFSSQVAGDYVDSYAIVPGGPNLIAQGGINDFPPGVTLNATSGVVSGTPTVKGQYWTSVSAIFHRGTFSRAISTRVFFDVF